MDSKDIIHHCDLFFDVAEEKKKLVLGDWSSDAGVAWAAAKKTWNGGDMKGGLAKMQAVGG